MIELIHPIKIYKKKYTGDLDELLKNIEHKLIDIFDATTENNQKSMRNNGLCSYNAVRDLHLWPELTSYTDFLTEHVKVYWSELKFDSARSPKILDTWANIYCKDSFIDSHNHSPVAIVASFYLKKPENSGNIVFEHPLETILKHQPIDTKYVDDYHAWFDHEVNVDEGDMILFPGWLKHKTLPNNNTLPKIIIGTNIV
jgi:uncharacterized protein (TIGR02466 family)